MHLNRVVPSDGYLLVVLTRDAPPKVTSIEEVPEAMIQVDDSNLNDAGLGDWLGFYDWLRNRSKTVIGVRIWLDEDNAHISAIGECMNAVVPIVGRELSIFFGADREFDKSLSDDQDFGGNKLFVGASMYALTFNAPVAR
ncbi:hypothetical protein RF679_15735 [Undibacterium cyanobacteriorum]|uniref:Barstar (barnase inhibitor) domain-containing protein n=1 Tax=Undibacterium cyanobacteriorum TaxID=3073561 RepID=A0ABY9RFU1_9BURK|nr:hypothetical protein [Undibacterium sp. 20NA77.5]WMW80084.1 hypothetical protein RF679_15735 [Undibacterium sp. 20NA77.5]